MKLLGRLALKGRNLDLAELPPAAAALACLQGPRHERAEETLRRLL